MLGAAIVENPQPEDKTVGNRRKASNPDVSGYDTSNGVRDWQRLSAGEEDDVREQKGRDSA
jgi:hypothetical protein